MSKVQNLKAYVLDVGSYGVVSSDPSVSYDFFPQEIVCLSDGSITVNAVGGGSFSWNATAGKKIFVISSLITINSGQFIAFFSQNKNLSSIFMDMHFLVDENGDNFVDENGDNFLMV